MPDQKWPGASCSSTRWNLVRNALLFVVLLHQLCFRTPFALVITRCVLVVRGILVESFQSLSGMPVKSRMGSYWSPNVTSIEHYWKTKSSRGKQNPRAQNKIQPRKTTSKRGKHNQIQARKTTSILVVCGCVCICAVFVRLPWVCWLKRDFAVGTTHAVHGR